MKIALADDMETDRRQIRDCLRSVADEEGFPLEITEFSSGNGLLSGFAPYVFDAVFLDVYMPGQDGMETARSIRRQDGSVRLVFVTTSREHAVESYQVDCSFYLVKPVMAPDVRDALLHCRLPELDPRMIRVMSGGAPVMLHASSILYAERTKSAYRTIRIFLKDGSFVDTRMAYEDFAPLLLGCGGFCPSNRSCIVNVAEIGGIAEGFVTLTGGFRLPVSRSKSAALREAYARYIFAKTRGEAYS